MTRTHLSRLFKALKIALSMFKKIWKIADTNNYMVPGIFYLK
jgi:isopropylmalate/homocitrate/citramalate synthase